MMTCDRCGKKIDWNTVIETERNYHVGNYDACCHCAAEFDKGRRQIREEIRELEEQRMENWGNEWLRNKPRAKE